MDKESQVTPAPENQTASVELEAEVKAKVVQTYFYLVDTKPDKEILKARGIERLSNDAQEFLVQTFHDIDELRLKPEKPNPNQTIIIISNNTPESVQSGIKLRDSLKKFDSVYHITVHCIDDKFGKGKSVWDWCDKNKDASAFMLKMLIDDATHKAWERKNNFQIPVPLNTERAKEDFPTVIFPKELETFIKKLSSSINTRDNTIASVLVVDAVRASILKKFMVWYPCEDEDGSYKEPTFSYHVNSYDIVEGGASTGKSAAVKPIVFPFKAYLRETEAVHERIKSNAEIELIAVNEAISVIEKRVKDTAKDQDPSAVTVDDEDKSNLSKLKQRRKLLESTVNFDWDQVTTSGDLTMETIPVILKNTGGVFSLFDDEGRLFDKLTKEDRKDDTSRTDTINRAWDGDDLSKRRVGSGKDEVPNAVLQFVTLTQDVTEITVNGRLNTKGTNARCLVWHQDKGRVNAKHSNDLRGEDTVAYNGMIRHFLDWKAFYDDEETLKASALEFTDEARHVIVNTYQALCDAVEFDEDGVPEDDSWERKRCKDLCTTALVFQLMYDYYKNPEITREEFATHKIGYKATYAAKMYVEFAASYHQYLSGRDDLEQRVLTSLLKLITASPAGTKVQGNMDEIVFDGAFSKSHLRGNQKQRQERKTWAESVRGIFKCSDKAASEEVLLALSELGYLYREECVEDGKEHFHVNPYTKELRGIIW